jgi:cytochrome P450
LNCAGTSIIILNSYEKAVELLETKSSIYSDRADAPMATDLVGWKDNLAFLQYGSRFREGRKLFHKEFGTPKLLERFQPQQEDESMNLLRNLAKNPENMEKIVSE